jgi:hypothetical protein
MMIMMHHDASWCIMMYHDVSWCIMMYHDVSWCIMRFRVILSSWLLMKLMTWNAP